MSNWNSIEDVMAKAEALYDVELNAFASKAAQKDAMGYLNRVYELLRRADHGELIEKLLAEGLGSEDDAYWAELNARDLPFNLHQYRPAKHDTRWVSAERCTQAGQLVTLRQLYKSAEILPKQVSAKAEMRKQELAAAKAVKDDGFRVHGLSNEFWYCQNQLGTQWYRCDWYRDGARVSFTSICAFVGKCYKVWEEAGKPDMKDWNYQETKEFFGAA